MPCSVHVRVERDQQKGHREAGVRGSETASPSWSDPFHVHSILRGAPRSSQPDAASSAYIPCGRRVVSGNHAVPTHQQPCAWSGDHCCSRRWTLLPSTVGPTPKSLVSRLLSSPTSHIHAPFSRFRCALIISFQPPCVITARHVTPAPPARRRETAAVGSKPRLCSTDPTGELPRTPRLASKGLSCQSSLYDIATPRRRESEPREAPVGQSAACHGARRRRRQPPPTTSCGSAPRGGEV